MQQDLPLQLFFDSSLDVVPGETGAWRWGVLNRSDQAITEVRITLFCANREAMAAEVGTLPQGLSIIPGVCWPLVQFLKVADGIVKLPIEVQLSGCLADGSGFELVSPHPQIFPFGDPKKNEPRTRIVVEQGGIIRNLGDHDNLELKICGEAIVDLERTVPPGAAKPRVNLEDHPFHLAINRLDRVPLARRENAGLAPLDLEQFAASWCGRRNLHLHFVNEHHQPRGQAAKVKDICSLHLDSVAGGYLTLLYRGTSGKHYLFAPNSSVTQENFFIPAGGSFFLPGELLHLPLPAWPAMDILTFNDPGLELALALLTPKPLLEQSVAFDFVEYPQQKVVALLRAAMRMPGTALALARIEIEKPRSWD